jgi:hypothetical protein
MMKKLFQLIALTLVVGSVSSAQSIDFEPSSIPDGSLGIYSNPGSAGAALKIAYPQISDWNSLLQINSSVTRSSMNFNKALLFEKSDSWMVFGPLAEGSFFFMMLTEATGSGNNYNYAECEVQVYTSSNIPLGIPEIFSVSNNSPADGAQFCSVSAFVPDHGYVRIKAATVNFRGFYIDQISGTGTPLPVELTSFRSYLKNDLIELQWTTATELNNFGFDVERSTDGENWSALGFVAGNGTSYSPRHYAFRDAGIDHISGNLYYRLKQMDLDGTSEYSGVLRVALTAPASVSLTAYPQPFAESLSIHLSSAHSEEITVTLFNSAMQKVSSVYEGPVDGSMSMTVPTADLRDGSYFLVVNHTNGAAQVQKLIHLRSR